MKQIQFEYTNSEKLEEEFEKFKQSCDLGSGSNMIFQIFSEILEEKVVLEVCDVIARIFPEAPYMGCSTSGNIIDCELSTEITVVCTVFEYPTTQVKLFQYDLSELSVDDVTAEISEQTKKNPWVKAIEMFFTIPETSTTKFCDGLKDIREDIQIFGGVACSDDITSDASCVFSKEGGFSEKSILIVFYGGEDFYVRSIKVTGWKPLGRTFHVTKSDGSILYELDGIRAYDVYHKYLNIKNDENFFYNTLEFPLFYEHNDTTILRTPVASNADGSITMSSDIDVGSVVRISYGDPKTIIANIKQDSIKIREFVPDILHIFSCAARRTFWTDKVPTYEIRSLKDVASSSGFFSHGEFLRTKGNLNQHNVTLVIAAMREGERGAVELPAIRDDKAWSKLPLVTRLAMFISATSEELAQINSRLEVANRNLAAAAITDGLTGLYNRAEIQRRIVQRLESIREEKFSLIMLDIDNFKLVNDTYGHQEGDTVIIKLADILKNNEAFYSQEFFAGRWGGEEFMLLVSGETDLAEHIAECIRKGFENTVFPSAKSQTVSLGVTQARMEDTPDTLCTRVDTALYEAKKTGKNRVVVL